MLTIGREHIYIDMCFPLMASLVEEWKLGTELHVKKRKEIYSDT